MDHLWHHELVNIGCRCQWDSDVTEVAGTGYCRANLSVFVSGMDCLFRPATDYVSQV